MMLTSCQGNNTTNTPVDNKTDLAETTYVSPSSDKGKKFNYEVPERFKLVAKNQYIELYLEQSTMAIAVRNIKNGYLWASYDIYRDFDTEISEKKTTVEIVNQMKSGINMTTYSVFTPGLRTLLDKDLLGNKTVTIKYTMKANGFTAKIDFTKIKISLDVDVIIDEKQLIASIPYESIKEYDPNLWAAGNNDIILSNLSLYPYFGSVESTVDGYTVIPDGSGALISLTATPKYSLGYSAPVYGRDLGYLEDPTLSEIGIETVRSLARVTLPLYGIIHHQGNAGLAVFAEEGENYATVNYVPKGLATKYYQTYFQYLYRTSYRQFQSRVNKDQYILGFQVEPNHFNIKQHYAFLDDDADYVGVAKSYRNWLIEENKLNKRDSKNGLSTQITVIGSDVKQGIFGKQNVAVSTYSGTQKLVENLVKDEFNNLVVTYKTLDKNSATLRFNVANYLGGKKNFNKLKDYLDENEIEFEIVSDYSTSYKNSKDVALRMSRNAMYSLTYNQVYPQRYLLKTSQAVNYFNGQKEMFKSLGIESIALANLDYAIYTSSKESRQTLSSSANMKDISSLLESIENAGIKVSAYNPDSYLFGYVSRYYDIPITSSNILPADATIPLLQLVLGGSANMYSTALNFISNQSGTLLRMAEYGINPSYFLTAGSSALIRNTTSSNVYISDYDSMRERMKENNDFLAKALEASSSNELTYHTFPISGVSLSRFGNKTLLVNYNTQSVNYEGHSVPARGYIVYEE
jgi:hypothetical protein